MVKLERRFRAMRGAFSQWRPYEPEAGSPLALLFETGTCDEARFKGINGEVIEYRRVPGGK